MGECIAIVSGRGGVGKTIITANLGVALAFENKKVCLVDANLGNRDLDLALGLENRIIYDLNDIIEDNIDIENALVKDKEHEELFLISATCRSTIPNFNNDKMKVICENLCKSFDYILIDCPTGISTGFRFGISGAKKAIVITTPTCSSVWSSNQVINSLMSEFRLEVNDIKLIVNKDNENLRVKKLYMDILDIEDVLGIENSGIIKDDIDVISSHNTGSPIVCNSSSAVGRSFRQISKNIVEWKS